MSVWDVAGRQHIQPLVAHLANRNDRSLLLPNDVQQGMKSARLQTTVYNMAIHAELERLAHLLSDHGIPVVPLKGTQLAKRAFGALNARRCGDIDVLVRRRDYERALALIEADGYRPRVERKPGVRKHSFHGIPLIRDEHGRRFVIELHWTLNDPRFLSIDDRKLWSRVLHHGVQAGSLHELPPEELLLFLSTHLPKHNSGLLRLIVDLDRLVRREERAFDWNYVEAIARSWGAPSLLHYSLSAAVAFFQTPVPTDVIERLRPMGVERSLIDLLAGPVSVLRPPEGDHLRANRFRLAYCLMLTPVHRSAHAYWRYILLPEPDEGEDSATGTGRRIAEGLAWTGISIGTAGKDRIGTWLPRLATSS